MKVLTENIEFGTKGGGEIVNITDDASRVLARTGLKEGVVTFFIPGATGALTTIEFENGLIKDTKNLFKKIAPESAEYFHDAGNPAGNAPSHLRASLVGPSLSVPFSEGKLQLGVWQQIVFMDFDNRPRKRNIILKIIGE